MKQKIKSALFAALTLGLVAATAVAYTWAFDAPETTMGSKENTFTSGSIKTQLTERAWNNSKADDDTGADYDTAVLGETKAKNYVEGQAIPKNPKMTNNSNYSISEYVAIRASFYIKVGANYYFYTKSEFEGAIAELYADKHSPKTPLDGTDDEKELGTGWTAGANNMFYYNTALAKGASSERLFDSVKVKSFEKSGNDYNIPVYHTAVTAVNENNPLAKDNSATTASATTITSSSLPEFHIGLYGYAVSADGYTESTAQAGLNALAGISS